VDVGGERTAFIARRGGRAYVTPADGEASGSPQAKRWSSKPSRVRRSPPTPRRPSTAGTTGTTPHRKAHGLRERALCRPGIYGASDLDRHGRWRVVPEYGPVWMPTGVPAGWAPTAPVPGSSTRTTAGPGGHRPLGWAPYHYGRWVHVGGFWAGRRDRRWFGRYTPLPSWPSLTALIFR